MIRSRVYGVLPMEGSGLNPFIPARGEFKTTRWSLVMRAGDANLPDAHKALGDLCRDYWYPLYAYTRRRGYSPHDAQDLTQSFILEVIHGPLLGRADPGKGRFRSFMLGSLQNFLSKEHRSRLTLKRGGQHEFVSLDATKDEERYGTEAANPKAPDDHFERNWAFALLDRVLVRLGADYESAGRKDLFEALRPYLAGKEGQAGYEEMGRRLGLSANTVGVSVHRMRRRYGELLREEISATVSSPEEIDGEIAHLRAVLAGE